MRSSDTIRADLREAQERAAFLGAEIRRLQRDLEEAEKQWSVMNHGLFELGRELAEAEGKPPQMREKNEK